MCHMFVAKIPILVAVTVSIEQYHSWDSAQNARISSSSVFQIMLFKSRQSSLTLATTLPYGTFL